MPKVYLEVGKEVDRLVGETADRWHPGLKENGVTICVLFVELHDGEGACLETPCLNHHGYPAAAIMKINGYKDRVEGKADATLVIDKFVWEDMNERQQVSLLDHELHHLLVKVDKAGSVKHDDLGRPILKLRKHEFELGGFYSIAARHKRDAVEYLAVTNVAENFSKMDLPLSAV